MHVVDLDLRGTDQRGVLFRSGQASVVLVRHVELSAAGDG